MTTIENILEQDEFTKADLVELLNADEENSKLIFRKAAKVKEEFVGNKVYYRGLIEFSNICSKDCLYCGIRKSNKNTNRYNIGDKDILEAAKFAYENNYASLVLQSGERSDKQFVDRIDNLLKEIKKLSKGKLGITISLGEQTDEVYKRWFDSGAHRYLLRIESSTKELYEKIHPVDKKHDYNQRLAALKSIQNAGYQTGTGVMVGLPFQTNEDLAEDLMFFRDFNIDMIGMGPYIEHEETPLFQHKDKLLPLEKRLHLTLKMIAIVRIMMKDINIAAATALQAIDPVGREKALQVGANVIMPNITPTINRKDYKLYQNKPCVDEGADDCINCLEARIHLIGNQVGYGEWGDSKYFSRRIAKK
ncbi:MAG: [FeFe] hydrogenase H-cluster radical SAM maturase HydE [Saprospiraceae bacterium]|nr:[FeFe] hydrogenase H-cluster radical SAM maturase HydE [Saprospiraceae bacterium]